MTVIASVEPQMSYGVIWGHASARARIRYLLKGKSVILLTERTLSAGNRVPQLVPSSRSSPDSFGLSAIWAAAYSRQDLWRDCSGSIACDGSAFTSLFSRFILVGVRLIVPALPLSLVVLLLSLTTIHPTSTEHRTQDRR